MPVQPCGDASHPRGGGRGCGRRRVRRPPADPVPELSAPIIGTSRLRLRPHRPDDLSALARIWADPRVTRHIGATRTEHEVWLRLLAHIGHWTTAGFGYWVIERAGGVIGEAGFVDFKRPVHPALDAPEAGWALAAEAWGQGYATETVAALSAWADARGWRETQALIDPANTPSLRIAERAGYRDTGEVHWPGGKITRRLSRQRG